MSLLKCPDCSSNISDQATNCPCCGRPMRLTRTSRIVELLKSIPIAIGVLTLGFGVYQYMKAQDWNRAKFIADEMHLFESKLEVREAMMMVRWDGRNVRLNFKGQSGKDTKWVANEELRDALKPPNDKPSMFSTESAQIRDYFDIFFTDLDRFAHFIRAGLVSKDDLAPYLDQWITALDDRGHYSDKPKILRKYVHCARYTGVEYLIDLWGLRSTDSILCTDDDVKNKAG